MRQPPGVLSSAGAAARFSEEETTDAPTDFNENRYSYLVASWRRPANVDYQVESPAGRFERRVHRLFRDGQRSLHREEFALALDAFRELPALILVTADPHRTPGFQFPMDAALVNTLAVRAGEILGETPPTVYRFPQEVVPEVSKLPAAVQQKVKPAVESELHVTSFQGAISGLVEGGLAAAAREDRARSGAESVLPCAGPFSSLRCAAGNRIQCRA